MSKRLLLVPLLFALLALPALSAESGPSNTVGFISFNAESGAWVPFSFPFTYYNEGHTPAVTLNEIMIGDFFGGNPATGDRIYDQNTLTFVYYTLGGTWSTTWDTIIPGHAYWTNIRGAENVMALTAGEVDMSPLELGTMQVGIFTPVGLREPGVVEPGDLGLIEAGFTGGNPATSDRLWDQNQLSFAYYNSLTSAWIGLQGDYAIQPGSALWILVNNTSFEWTYTPLGTPPEVDLMVPATPTPVVPRADAVLQESGVFKVQSVD